MRLRKRPAIVGPRSQPAKGRVLPGILRAAGTPKAVSPNTVKPVMTGTSKARQGESQVDRRLIGLRGDLAGIFHEDGGGQLLLEGQLGETDAHDRRWRVLQHEDPTAFGQAVGSQLLPSPRRGRLPAGQPRLPAGGDFRQSCRSGAAPTRAAPVPPHPATEKATRARLLRLDPGVPARRAASHPAAGSQRASAAGCQATRVEGESAQGTADRRRRHAAHPVAMSA